MDDNFKNKIPEDRDQTKADSNSSNTTSPSQQQKEEKQEEKTENGKQISHSNEQTQQWQDLMLISSFYNNLNW